VSNIKIIINSTDNILLEGKLNQKTVSGLWQQRNKFIAENGRLVIDLSSITNSDSSGLAFLTCLQKEAIKAKQQLSFVNIPNQLQKLITLSGLEDVLNYNQTI